MTIVPRGFWSMYLGSICIQCPKCRDIIRLKHRIAKDGTVTPLVGCRRCLWVGKIGLAEYRSADAVQAVTA